MKNLLYLAHCVPNPPNKGEKIRAHHEITQLASQYRIHLVCFARSESEVDDARALSGRCATLYVERLSPRAALGRAVARFSLGACLNQAFYQSSRMREYVTSLAGQLPLDATLAYSVVMAQYSPRGVPLLIDMVDVDSEKWFQYARTRRPAFAYALEARRLRQLEIDCTRRAAVTVLTTENEASLLRSFAPQASVCHIENGVDGEFFDGALRPPPAEFAGRKFVAFIGAMDYSPNVDAVVSFARRILPELRRRDPQLEFFIVGRNPSKSVLQLSAIKGVVVTGGVPDTRPFLSGARAIVAPLRLARGIQNKVLEALAMGRVVFASDEICKTFGSTLPPGVLCCASDQDFIEQVATASAAESRPDPFIRSEALRRFSWNKAGELLVSQLDNAIASSQSAPASANR
ncbi:MAG: sugar transferase [Bryobacterales bacterium]|nr:sugar transferase [Bryobacterales bacterium]